MAAHDLKLRLVHLALPLEIVLKIEPERFRLLMDGLMLLSGLTLLWAAFFRPVFWVKL